MGADNRALSEADRRAVSESLYKAGRAITAVEEIHAAIWPGGMVSGTDTNAARVQARVMAILVKHGFGPSGDGS